MSIPALVAAFFAGFVVGPFAWGAFRSWFFKDL
jgi:hypothetical protein